MISISIGTKLSVKGESLEKGEIDASKTRKTYPAEVIYIHPLRRYFTVLVHAPGGDYKHTCYFESDSSYS